MPVAMVEFIRIQGSNLNVKLCDFAEIIKPGELLSLDLEGFFNARVVR